jgi:hypothetical protein
MQSNLSSCIEPHYLEVEESGLSTTQNFYHHLDNRGVEDAYRQEGWRVPYLNSGKWQRPLWASANGPRSMPFSVGLIMAASRRTTNSNPSLDTRVTYLLSSAVLLLSILHVGKARTGAEICVVCVGVEQKRAESWGLQTKKKFARTEILLHTLHECQGDWGNWCHSIVIIHEQDDARSILMLGTSFFVHPQSAVLRVINFLNKGERAAALGSKKAKMNARKKEDPCR